MCWVFLYRSLTRESEGFSCLLGAGGYRSAPAGALAGSMAYWASGALQKGRDL